MSAIILDTETTGIEDADPVQLAWTDPIERPLNPLGIVTCLYFKPRKPISLGAMATHHIIELDVAGAEGWTGKWPIPPGVKYIVGHNIDFDWKVIGSPDVKRICTLALARHVWPKIDSHSLSAVIYHLYPQPQARDLVRSAHDAAADVCLTQRVLFAICNALNLHEWDRVWELSEKARVPTHMLFGKYKGLPVAHVPRDYVAWLSRQPDTDPYLMKAFGR